MNNTRNSVVANREKTKKLTFLAIMTALVIVLQYVGAFIKIGMFSPSLVLIPIVLGAVINGIGGGAWLGTVFGAMTLLDSAAFMTVSAPITVILCFTKGILAGVASAAAYKLLSRINSYLGAVVAAMVCPIVNTGVFLLGCAAFFLPTIQAWVGEFESVVAFMFVGLVGPNFLLEFAINVLLSPVLVTLIKLLDRTLNLRSGKK